MATTKLADVAPIVTEAASATATAVTTAREAASAARDAAEAARVATVAMRDLTRAHNTNWWGIVLKKIFDYVGEIVVGVSIILVLLHFFLHIH